eukprot:409228_1
MNNKKRKKQRKSKQHNNINYFEKFKYIEQAQEIDNSEAIEWILYGYIRKIQRNMDQPVPTDIARLCYLYFNIQQHFVEGHNLISNIIPNITNIKCKYHPTHKKWNKSQIPTHCTLTFSKTFDELCLPEKRLICKTIIQDRNWPVHILVMWKSKADRNNYGNNQRKKWLQKELYCMEYILCQRYNTIIKLDLSDMGFKDIDILYLCNMIQNIIKHNIEWTFSEKQLLVKNTTHKPKYYKNGEEVKKISKQLIQKKVKVDVSMELKELCLSNNHITDRGLEMLLKTIKKYMPQLKLLDLGHNPITNKSFSTIIASRLNHKKLSINLKGCNAISSKSLDKYKQQYGHKGVEVLI